MNLHSHDIKNGCIIVNVTMVLNEDLELPHASIRMDTLSKEKGAFIEWDVS